MMFAGDPTRYLPDGDGLDVLRQIKSVDPEILVILLTGYSSVELAVEAMKQGAYHYANKPFNLDEIMLLVEKALETTQLRREVRALRTSQAQPYKKRVEGIASDAMARLQAYGWPGNIRELRNAVERAMLLGDSKTLTLDDFPTSGGATRLAEGVALPPNGIDLDQLEQSLVFQALERSGWNQTRAAALLGLNRDQIRYRIEKFKLERVSS